VRTDGLLVTNYETFDLSPLAALDRGYVVGATPFATRMGRLLGVASREGIEIYWSQYGNEERR
jgi:hypothetical protein